MVAPSIPDNEPERLQALYSLFVLDTPNEPVFDAITKLVKQFFDVPIVVISLIDSHRQWFKSKQGLSLSETERDISLCSHAILQDDIMVVEDATKDRRFCDSPLVTEDPKTHYYAGCPIKSTSGHRIGALCIVDTKVRHITPDKLSFLKDFVLLIEQEFFAKRKSISYLSEVAKIQEMHISGSTDKELSSHILSFLIKRTASECGFIAPVSKGVGEAYVIGKVYRQEKEGLKHDEDCFGSLFSKIKEVLSQEQPIVFNNGGSKSKDINNYIVIPIKGNDGLLAMYALVNRQSGYDEAVVEELSAVTKLISSVLESARNIATMEDMANKDALTGVYIPKAF